jgi:uncharacterized protein
VNPEETEVLGEKSYPDLDSVSDAIDIVDIFRRSEFVPDIVEAAIRKGAKVIWMQEDVVHEEAARLFTCPGIRTHRNHRDCRKHKRGPRRAQSANRIQAD